MSDFSVSRPGLNYSTASPTDAKELFYKIFSGEVLTAFETQVILKGLTRQRTIPNGKSAAFPLVYKATASYHTPGTEIDGQQIKSSEKVITIDDLLVAPVFVANIDEAMSAFEVRSIYSSEMGKALALAYDKNVCRNILLAARGAAQINGQTDTAGAFLQDADGATSATSLADSIIDAKRIMDEKDVPVDSTQVYAAVKAAQWYLMAKETTKLMNRDVAAGDYATGRLPLLGGVKVVKSNAFVFGSDDSSNTAIPAAYRAAWSTAISVVFTEAAAATVQLLGLAMESEYSARHQGTLLVGKYAVGHGPLLHKCAVEIGSAATAG